MENKLSDLQVKNAALEKQRMSNRLVFLDDLKGLCILLVVFCHFVLLPADSVAGNIIMSICWVAVPCFIMTTGYLLHKKETFDWKRYFTRLVTTYIVFVVWRLIYMCVQSNIYDETHTVSEYIRATLFAADINGVDFGALWYMKAYIVIYLIYPVTWFLFRHDGRKFVLGMLIVSFIGDIGVGAVNILLSYFGSFDISSVSTLVPYTNYAFMLTYFLIGAFMHEYRDDIKNKINRYIPVILFVVGVLLIVLEKYIETKTMSWNNIYLNNGYKRISVMLASIGLFMCFNYYSSNKENVFGKYVGQCTMGVYYIHYILLILCVKYIYPYINIENYSLAANLIKTVVMTAVCMVITCIVRRIPLLKKMVI